ncbi:MAG: bifunctional glutamate N-acetyltransferase/amino-acid acetyltransferase ArgJ [Clostridia bacterium]|nr:bifunctional glutamate N-acetyltransferase/amino-acid acetyltransferase ArgJ [Clostridia bacterium]
MQTTISKIPGGICAPAGFKAAGIHCGIRHNKTKRDLALIVSDTRASAAALYTSNLVKGAPIYVTREHLKDGYAQAVIANSGNANTCNRDGLQVARAMADLAAGALGIPASDVVVASTGVIGQPLSIEPIAAGIPALVEALSADGSLEANEAIMTTDTKTKSESFAFELDGKTCAIGGIAKGSGMIHPNLATMLVFLTTDVSITPDLLERALRADAQDTFNMVSVDGDTSTNDTLCILANGRAGNRTLRRETDPGYDVFCQALHALTSTLCRQISADGEGATRRMEVTVSGAADKESARRVAKSVACSSLTKAALFGADANWGRVLCAIGYAGVPVDIDRVDVDFVSAKGEIAVCRDGAGVPFSEEKAKEILLEKEIEIRIRLHDGEAQATAFGCDLTYEYVRINGDYRT